MGFSYWRLGGVKATVEKLWVKHSSSGEACSLLRWYRYQSERRPMRKSHSSTSRSPKKIKRDYKPLSYKGLPPQRPTRLQSDPTKPSIYHPSPLWNPPTTSANTSTVSPSFQPTYTSKILLRPHKQKSHPPLPNQPSDPRGSLRHILHHGNLHHSSREKQRHLNRKTPPFLAAPFPPPLCQNPTRRNPSIGGSYDADPGPSWFG